MIKIMQRGTKQFFLDKFAKSKHLDKVKEFKEDKLVLYIADEDEFYRQKQRTTFHMILKALWESGETSYNSYEEMRNDIKKRCGFITYDKSFLCPTMKNIQNRVYSLLPTEELKQLHKETILQGREVHRSLGDATKDEYIMLIKDALSIVDELGVSSKQLDEARQQWESLK